MYLPQWYSAVEYMFSQAVSTHRCSCRYPMVLNWSVGETQSHSLSWVWTWGHTASQSPMNVDTAGTARVLSFLCWSYIQLWRHSAVYWCILERHRVLYQPSLQTLGKSFWMTVCRAYSVVVNTSYIGFPWTICKEKLTVPLKSKHQHSGRSRSRRSKSFHRSISTQLERLCWFSVSSKLYRPEDD